MKEDIEEAEVLDETVGETSDTENKKEEHKDTEIKISPNHGLNASLQVCPICGKNMGIVLHGRIDEDDSKAPVQEQSFVPCEDCQKTYITIAGAVKKEDGTPEVTGERIYIKRENLTEEFKKESEGKAVAFMDKEEFDKLYKSIKEQQEKKQ